VHSSPGLRKKRCLDNRWCIHYRNRLRRPRGWYSRRWFHVWLPKWWSRVLLDWPLWLWWGRSGRFHVRTRHCLCATVKRLLFTAARTCSGLCGGIESRLRASPRSNWRNRPNKRSAPCRPLYWPTPKSTPHFKGVESEWSRFCWGRL